jgi:hypothetical protein
MTEKRRRMRDRTPGVRSQTNNLIMHRHKRGSQPKKWEVLGSFGKFGVVRSCAAGGTCNSARPPALGRWFRYVTGSIEVTSAIVLLILRLSGLNSIIDGMRGFRHHGDYAKAL